MYAVIGSLWKVNWQIWGQVSRRSQFGNNMTVSLKREQQITYSTVNNPHGWCHVCRLNRFVMTSSAWGLSAVHLFGRFSSNAREPMIFEKPLTTPKKTKLYSPQSQCNPWNKSSVSRQKREQFTFASLKFGPKSSCITQSRALQKKPHTQRFCQYNSMNNTGGKNNITRSAVTANGHLGRGGLRTQSRTATFAGVNTVAETRVIVRAHLFIVNDKANVNYWVTNHRYAYLTQATTEFQQLMACVGQKKSQYFIKQVRSQSNHTRAGAERETGRRCHYSDQRVEKIVTANDDTTSYLPKRLRDKKIRKQNICMLHNQPAWPWYSTGLVTAKFPTVRSNTRSAKW